MAMTPFRLEPGAAIHPDRLSPHPRPALAELPVGESLGQVLLHHGRQRPDAAFGYFIDGDGLVERVSWRDALGRAEAVAISLAQTGAHPGERVVLALPTSLDLLVGFVACQLLGAVPCIVEPPPAGRGLKPWALRLVPKLSVLQPCAIVTSSDSVEPVREALPEQHALIVDARPAHAPERLTWYRAPDTAPAFLQFTSGTTDRPKAVACSHRAIFANIRGFARLGLWNEGDLLVNWLPLFHDMGLVASTLAPILHGIPVALMSPQMFLMRPARWLWAIHAMRGTISFAPNFAYQLCVKRVEEQDTVGLDLSCWRLAMNAAEFVHADTLDKFEGRFASAGFSRSAFTPSYGMAEMVVGISTKRPGEPVIVDRISRSILRRDGRAVPASEDDDATEIVQVGTVLEGHDVRIADANGNELAEREEGEIQIRGPSLFSGYYGNEAATNEVIVDGWLRTGDLGYLAGGRLFVSGRAKDVIIRGGENFHPHSLELAAATVLGVREGCVAAVGVPNLVSGTEDVVVAYETQETLPETLMAMGRRIEDVLQRCTGLRPDRVIPLAPRAIPKTTSGKIQRGLVRKLLADIGPEPAIGTRIGLD
jgi:acyl-CoA synthetase (AMP-forming)/AMP-acid ligase II